jgi:hypothetical protein
VRSILENGYKIPVSMTDTERRTRYREKNNQSARLLAAGQIVKVPTPPLCTNPLSVAYKVNMDGTIKKRLVINLSRWANGFVRPDSFKMAQFNDALAQSLKGDYQSVFDISKAYHHLRLHPSSYELVGFCLQDVDGKERFYHYVVVVFGLGPAGQALGRVMRPIMIYLAKCGIRNMMYVDDGRVGASTKLRANADYAKTLEVFEKAGFTVNREKSDKLGDSAQRKEYLGFCIDTKEMAVYVPELKLARVLGILNVFMRRRRHRVRDIASVVGKLISLEPALGRSVLVGTRLATIQIVVATEVSDASRRRENPWSKWIEVEDDTFAALHDVWLRAAEWNGCPIKCLHTGITLSSVLPMEATALLDRKIPARMVYDRQAIMASDASDFAVASYSIEGLPEFSFSAELTLEERGESSSTRELLAIQRTLEHWAGSDTIARPLEQVTLWWLTDNQNVEKMLAKGSGKIRIMKLVLDISERGRRLLLDLQPVWVSRDNPFLLKADAISKGVDTDNWEVSRADYDHLNLLFGPFSIDLFATRDNAKAARFYSRSWEMGTQGVDSFTQNWQGECAYAAPPVSLVMRTIRKVAITVMSGILIIPLWKNAKCWTFALRDGIHLNAMFESVQIVRMHTLAWEFLKKNIIGGKEIQFLVIKIGSVRGPQALESQTGKDICFRTLFGRSCESCV